MILIARWLVKLIPFSDYGYLIPPGYENQENCKIAENFLSFNVTLRTVWCDGKDLAMGMILGSRPLEHFSGCEQYIARFEVERDHLPSLRCSHSSAY